MMGDRKLIYFLLFIGLILLVLSSVSLDVSYSQNRVNNVPVYQNGVSHDRQYVNNANNVHQPNTIYAKIVSRPDVSVHKQLLDVENKFYSNRCDL